MIALEKVRAHPQADRKFGDRDDRSEIGQWRVERSE
jgi:hypothetical protein